MAIYNNVHNLRFDGIDPYPRMAIVNCPSDAMALGTLTLSEPVDFVGSVDVSVYRCLPPVGSSDAWTHADSTNYQLQVVPPVSFTWYQQWSDASAPWAVPGSWVLSWQYKTGAIADSSSGNYYSVEWAINKQVTPAVIQASPKFIVHVKDGING